MQEEAKKQKSARDTLVKTPRYIWERYYFRLVMASILFSHFKAFSFKKIQNKTLTLVF